MAVNDKSVATDLGALLRESLNDEVELTAKITADIPVQLATAPIGFTPPGGTVRASYASVHPSSPPSGIRPAVDHDASQPLAMASQPLQMPTPLASMMPALPTPLSMRSSVPVARPKSHVGLIVGLFAGAALLAGVGGGGFAWYRTTHGAAPSATTATVATGRPAATITAPAAVAATPAPVEKAAEALPAPPTTGTLEEAPVAPAAAPRPRSAAPAAPKAEPANVAPKAEPVAPAPKAAAPQAAPKPAAGAGVDALLQQQLSGAIP